MWKRRDQCDQNEKDVKVFETGKSTPKFQDILTYNITMA